MINHVVMSDKQYIREPHISFGKCDREVSFNPATHHWYDWSYSKPVDTLPTRLGPVRVDTLTEKKKVVYEVAFGVEHMMSYDVRFMKDKSGLLGIFTMVHTADDMGTFLRTDRGGFGYKSAMLYFDSFSEPKTGATHFIVTEYKTGEWGACAVCHHRDAIYYLTDYTEFLDRKGIVKGCCSEDEVLAELNSKYQVDLTLECFKRYDVNSFI